MEHLSTSERLIKVNYGGNVDYLCDYCFYYDGCGCRIWSKNILTGRIKNRNNYSRRKYYIQEEDPGEMSWVGLRRSSYLKWEMYYDQQQQLYQNASLTVSKDPVDLLYSALSQYITDWLSELLDTLLQWFSYVSDPFCLELKKNVQLSGGRAATIFLATNNLTTITTSSVGPSSSVKTISFSSFLPSFASTNVDVDIQTSKLVASGKVPSSSGSEFSSSFFGMLKKIAISKELNEEESEFDQGRGEVLFRGVFIRDMLRFARTMENKTTKKMTPPLRSCQQQRPVCKTNLKTSGHNHIATTNNNCSNSDLMKVLDRYTQKLGCSCVFTTDTIASSSYLGSLCERHPSLTLLATWPVYSTTSYTRSHTPTNNNKTVNKNTTILPTSQTKTTTNITSTQKNIPSSVISNLFILTYLTSIWSKRLSNSCSCAVYLDTSRRTGLSTRSPTWKFRNYILLAINILAFFTCVAGQCKVSTCQKQWPTYHMNTMNMDPLSDTYNCRALRTTWHCIRKVSHGCVGNIDYHSEKSRVQKQMSIRKCSTQGETYDSLDQTHKPPVQRPQPECMYKGKGTYKHCGLFGDPHLRTFNRVCQTCKIRGAWPLVDNNHLTVMVTNKPVVVDGSATATSMLTVRIRRNELCGANHFVTYETQANNLPSTFDDGRTHYGPGNGIELKVLEPNKHIKIHIKYIDTTILVRQIGRYFTFALWMPEEIVDDSNGNVPELCVRGCPKSEQINYQEFLAQKHQKLMEYKTQNKLVMSRHDAETLCRQAKVVDFYFDSCVFDLMTTGDRNFTVAAYSALHDLLKLNPEVAKSNKNRTDFHHYDQRFSGSTSTWTVQTIQKLILLCMTLLSLHTCSRQEEIC